MAIPVLAFLRWPAGTPNDAAFDFGPPSRRDESEAVYARYKVSLERTWANGSTREVFLKAWRPSGAAGASSAELASGSVAILLLEMRDILSVDQSVLESFFTDGARLCRFGKEGGAGGSVHSFDKASSAASLALVAAPLNLDGDDLRALENTASIPILIAIEKCVTLLRTEYVGNAFKSMKKR